MRGDLRDALRAVFVRDVFDDFVAPLHAEIDVEVGHGNALRIQEAFEEEVVGERVEVGDFQRVGDQRARAGTASGADRDVVVFRPLDEVGDDEEVAGEAHLVDDAQLYLKPRVIRRAFGGAFCFVREELRQAQLQSVLRALNEKILNRHAFRQRKIRQIILAERQLQIAAGGDRMRVGEKLRRIMKALCHHRIAGEMVLLREIARALVVGAQPAIADADAHLVHVVIVRRRETGEVGGNGGDTQFASGVAAPVEILRLARLAVPRQLQIVAVGENALPEGGAFFRALRIAAAKKTRQIAVNAAGKGNQPLALRRGEALNMHRHALMVLVVLIGEADQLAEMNEAGEILREQNQLVVRAVAVAHGEVATENRLDARRPRLLVELERTVEIVAVGQRNRLRALAFGKIDNLADTQNAVAQGKFAVDVQMGQGIHDSDIAVKKEGVA